jgi:hypothetical protein
MAISKLPRKLKIFGRTTKEKYEGEVIDEVFEDQPTEDGVFRKMIQLVRWKGDRKGEDYFIRFGYYVKDKNQPDKKFMWGSQTSFLAPRKLVRKLLNKAKKKGIL